MKKHNALFRLLLTVLFVGLCMACTSLKPYERVYINDPEMQMGTDATGNFKHYVYSIREGALPAGTSKSSGGCGCN